MEQSISSARRYERGLALKQAQMFESALAEFRQAAMDPQQSGKAYVQMALCLRSTERYVEAVAAFRQALTSASFSATERLHILYVMGQTLETLGRYAETLEVYRCIRNEDPEFLDIGERIKSMGAGGRRVSSSRQSESQLRGKDPWTMLSKLRTNLLTVLDRAWAQLSRYTESLESTCILTTTYPRVHDIARRVLDLHRPLKQADTPGRNAPLDRNNLDKRRHTRVPVNLCSQFSSTAWTGTGEGQLRDLSPWGCRVTSPLKVAVGAELECRIFPLDQLNPFTVDRATVRWSRSHEFGLAFTKIRPGVQREIAQLCRLMKPPAF